MAEARRNGTVCNGHYAVTDASIIRAAVWNGCSLDGAESMLVDLEIIGKIRLSDRTATGYDGEPCALFELPEEPAPDADGT